MGRRRAMPKQRKALGQVFLRSQWPAQKVIEQLQAWKVREVLEIGPGGGALTRLLVAAGFKVVAVEKDERFVERLNDLKHHWQEGAENLSVVASDVLRFDLESWLAANGEPKAIVGNIPYNISTSILRWMLPAVDMIRGSIFLVQLEFAQRVVALPGTKNYGSLSVYCQLRARCQLLCKVDRHCFDPVPKVDSALISITENPQKLADAVLKSVEQVTRLAFQQRRKKLKNALATITHEGIEASCPYDLNRRPETLSPLDYVELARFLESQQN